MASGLAGSSAVAVVCNPGAGGGRVKREWDELETRLRSVAPRPTILTTRYPGHATALTREALYDGYDRIVSVGGDGTHHEVVNGFFWDGASINPEAALAPLPLGTGSDLVRTIGLSRRGVARLFEAPRLFAADVGEAEYETFEGGRGRCYFINAASFGTGGRVAERVNRSRGRLLAFPRALLWEVLRLRANHFEITVDTERLEGRFVEVAVANARYYGGGICLNPAIRLDSGQLEVIAIHEVGLVKAAVNLPRFFRGRITESPHLAWHARGSEIAIRCTDVTLPATFDGELPGNLPARIRVLPKAIRLLAPG